MKRLSGRLLDFSDVLTGEDLGYADASELQYRLNDESPDSVAFITDVDISLPVDILDRLSRYVTQGAALVLWPVFT